MSFNTTNATPHILTPLFYNSAGLYNGGYLSLSSEIYGRVEQADTATAVGPIFRV